MKRDEGHKVQSPFRWYIIYCIGSSASADTNIKDYKVNLLRKKILSNNFFANAYFLGKLVPRYLLS